MLRQEVFDPAMEGQNLRSARLRDLAAVTAGHQPAWSEHPDLACIRAELADLPALVLHRELRTLRAALARVEAGKALLLQVGECAELFDMATPASIERRAAVYEQMADRLAERSGREVVLIMRMAGQHAKPRSLSSELLADGTEVPLYRGDAVNGLDPDPDARRPDPWRMLTSYDCSRQTMARLRSRPDALRPVFISHEALLRDYEEPLTRGTDPLYSAGAHFLWVGERTRPITGWHVQWAASIMNPVGVKIGPEASGPDLRSLVRTLNRSRRPGALSLIARMGAAASPDRLALLSRAVVRAGTPVLWQCDPMHGNTRKIGTAKTRLLPDLRQEITTFVQVLSRNGCRPGGLHLVVTPEDVGECHEELPTTADRLGCPPCDPRLNPAQAMDMIDHFADELAARPKSGTG